MTKNVDISIPQRTAQVVVVWRSLRNHDDRLTSSVLVHLQVCRHGRLRILRQWLRARVAQTKMKSLLPDGESHHAPQACNPRCPGSLLSCSILVASNSEGLGSDL